MPADKVSPFNPSPNPTLYFPQSFFAHPAEQVAPELIGCLLVKRQTDGDLLWGVIVETEAYCQNGRPPATGIGAAPRATKPYLVSKEISIDILVIALISSLSITNSQVRSKFIYLSLAPSA
jgi:hypothetical protein